MPERDAALVANELLEQGRLLQRLLEEASSLRIEMELFKIRFDALLARNTPCS